MGPVVGDDRVPTPWLRVGRSRRQLSESEVAVATGSGGRGSARGTGKATPAISVEPRPGGKWAVQKDGTQRASKVTDRKTDAVARARAQAKREGAELVIKDQQGRIQQKDSHGNDPRRTKG